MAICKDVRRRTSVRQRRERKFAMAFAIACEELEVPIRSLVRRIMNRMTRIIRRIN